MGFFLSIDNCIQYFTMNLSGSLPDRVVAELEPVTLKEHMYCVCMNTTANSYQNCLG